MDSLSAKNPLIKQIRRAAANGTLTEDGYAVAEGPHLLEEATKADREIKVVLAAESALAKISVPGAVPVRTVSDKTFEELATTEAPQGMIALVKPASFTIQELTERELALLVILDGVQEPGNAGAILRAADAFGATGVVFLKGTVNPYNPKCIRASAGSVFRVPLVGGVEVAGLPEIPLLAAMPRAERTIDSVDLRRACAIVIGSEGRGVRPELAVRALPVSIPTEGVESLNAAVAAGVLLYEASRQRRTSEPRASASAQHRQARGSRR